MAQVPDQITLLHLSDPQFGRNHRFGSDEPADTLLERLKADLDGLADSEGLRPDLLVLTGDLAEWAMPGEFDQVHGFITGLAEHLKLPPRRIALVPGNHDINRKLCEAHFLTQEASGDAPAPPYWPKWQSFKTLFDRLYADEPGIEFSDSAPWALFEVPDLKLVVAGLNSTIKESHRDEDHYGWVGEGQLKWFAERLKLYQAKGWLRIGAVHHNVRRGETADDENLKDAADLRRYLVDTDRLNLVLHGHTHESRFDWWTPTVPILTTGSAALTAEPRPPEVPNQYQIIRIEPGGLRLWCRFYDTRQKRFIADSRAAKDGNDWRRTERVIWVEGPWAPPEIGSTGGPEPEHPDGAIHASAVAAIAKILSLHDSVRASLASRLALAASDPAGLARRLCDRSDLNRGISDLKLAIPGAFEQLRRDGRPAAELCRPALDILGWLVIAAVAQDYNREDSPLVQPWLAGRAFEIPLGTAHGVETLMACWRGGKAEFTVVKGRVGRGRDDITPLPGHEDGFDDPAAPEPERQVNTLRRLAYQRLTGEPAPARLSLAQRKMLVYMLENLAQDERRRLYLTIDRRDPSHVVFDRPAVVAAITAELPRIGLVFIDSDKEPDPGIFILPEPQLAAAIHQFLLALGPCA